MKSQKGITLVALVVTIVVLLILAGTSIAMLSGDNGIITNAQKSTYANTEGEVMDKIKMAFNTVKTEVIAKSATISTYKATDTDNLLALANLVAKDLGGTGNITTTTADATTSKEAIGNYTVSVSGSASGSVITVKYDDGKSFTGTAGSNTPPYGAISYTITITDTNATLGSYSAQVIQ